MLKHVIYSILILFVLAGFSSMSYAQTVTGTVIDEETGDPLPGVNIILQGTQTGTATDLEGEFSINVPELDGTLEFRYVGYITKEVEVDGREEIEVYLEYDSILGDEVMVVGYGVQQRSLSTGAISRVESDAIAQSGALRAEQALQGRTAGVTVIQNSGQPGSGSTVRIRGIGTTGDADPLYMVDGMPVSNIDHINPGDIESIEVLKDASATAIYGARGANGVVMITTKGGVEGPIQISYEGYAGFQNPWRETDLLNAPEYMEIMNESYANDGRSIPFEDAEQIESEIGEGTNWQDEVFFRNAPVTNHNLSVSGGSEQSTYMSSLSYRYQDGIVAEGKSNYERITTRFNSNHNRGRFTYGNRLSYTYNMSRGIDPNEEFGGIMSLVANIDPVTPVRDEDGRFAQSPYASQEVVNPVASLDVTNSRARNDNLVGGVYGEMEISSNFSFRSTFDIDLAVSNTRSFEPEYDLGGNVSNSTTSAMQEENRYLFWQTNHVATFRQEVADHNYSILAGVEAARAENEWLGGTAYNLTMQNFDNAWLSTGTDQESAANWGGTDIESLLSYFTRVNYDYADRYMLEGVFRVDGSSKFGPDNRWGYFPAFSVGWMLSEEPFMSDFTNMNMLKIRGGWGQNGSDNIGQFTYTPTIVTHAGYAFGMDPQQVTGAYPGQIANPNLKWETSQQMNIGLESGFFDNRLTFNFDYYIKETQGLLLDAPIPNFIGSGAPTINGGDIQNTGFEVEAGFRQVLDDWRFSVNLTGTYNQNEVTSIDNDEGRLLGAGVSTAMDNVAMAEVGYPIAFFWGYETAGIFQSEEEVENHVNSEGEMIQPDAQPGDLIFVDQNDDGNLTDADRVKIGNPYPDFTAGFNFDVSWRNFDMNMFWYGAFGHDIFTGGTRRHDLNMPNWKDDVLERWTEDNPSETHPRVTIDDPNGNFVRPSDFFIESGSYVRLQNLNIGYSLPDGVTSFAGASNLRVYLAAQNLLTFTSYSGHDPEIGSGGPLDVGIDRNIYPQPRTVTVGLNIDF